MVLRYNNKILEWVPDEHRFKSTDPYTAGLINAVILLEPKIGSISTQFTKAGPPGLALETLRKLIPDIEVVEKPVWVVPDEGSWVD